MYLNFYIQKTAILHRSLIWTLKYFPNVSKVVHNIFNLHLLQYRSNKLAFIIWKQFLLSILLARFSMFYSKENVLTNFLVLYCTKNQFNFSRFTFINKYILFGQLNFLKCKSLHNWDVLIKLNFYYFFNLIFNLIFRHIN